MERMVASSDSILNGLRKKPTAPALRALSREVPAGLRYASFWFQAESAPELLEVARTDCGILVIEPFQMGLIPTTNLV